MADCIFCMIANKEIPGNIVYEDDRIVCFHDLEPQAPVHVLIIPKSTLFRSTMLKMMMRKLLGYIMTKVKDIAAILGTLKGYRLVNNCGEDGMQTVKHLIFICWERESYLAAGLIYSFAIREFGVKKRPERRFLNRCCKEPERGKV